MSKLLGDFRKVLKNKVGPEGHDGDDEEEYGHGGDGEDGEEEDGEGGGGGEVQAVSKKRPVGLSDDNDSDDDGDGDDESPAPASASGTALPAPPPPLSTQESVQSSSGQSTGSPAKQGKPGNPRWVWWEPGQGSDEPPPQLAQLNPGQWVQLSLTVLQQLYDALEAKWSSDQNKDTIKNAPRVKPYEWGGHKISIRKTDPEQADSSKQPVAVRRRPPHPPLHAPSHLDALTPARTPQSDSSKQPEQPPAKKLKPSPVAPTAAAVPKQPVAAGAASSSASTALVASSPAKPEPAAPPPLAKPLSASTQGSSSSQLSSPQHVALPKPRQPTKKATGENWVKVRIELESDVPVQPSYEYEVEYKQDILHAPPARHNNGLSPVFSANALIGGEKYKFRVRVRQGDQEGPWSSWSSALLCQRGRDAIDPELRRKMWADFYTATGEHEETGSRLDQPCLGCRARHVTRPTMLSPLLTNLDASHVIAYSLGGPSGDSPDHSWNFVPLCALCNRDHQKTKNLIDWLKEEGDKYGDYVPLYEVLIRLRRACVKNGRVNDSSAPPIWLQPPHQTIVPTFLLLSAVDIVEFACNVYQKGLQNLRPDDGIGNSSPFDSGKHGTDPHCTYVLDGKVLPRPGGFITTDVELMRIVFSKFKALSQDQMRERVNAMDDHAQSLRALAEKLQRKLNECTDHTAVIHLTTKLKPILEGVEREIDAL